MAQTLEGNTPWRAETDGQAVPPAVVCALDGLRLAARRRPSPPRWSGRSRGASASWRAD